VGFYQERARRAAARAIDAMPHPQVVKQVSRLWVPAD
jgi:hypothetical protein